MPFVGELKGKFLGRHRFKLTEDFTYITKDGQTITAPKNFITDGASIPRPFRSFVGSPWDYLYGWAAVIHDLGYKVQERTRKEVDDIFLEGMEEKGEALWRRRVMYRAVRLWSWIPWLIHKWRNNRADGITKKELDELHGSTY